MSWHILGAEVPLWGSSPDSCTLLGSSRTIHMMRSGPLPIPALLTLDVMRDTRAQPSHYLYWGLLKDRYPDLLSFLSRHGIHSFDSHLMLLWQCICIFCLCISAMWFLMLWGSHMPSKVVIRLVYTQPVWFCPKMPWTCWNHSPCTCQAA